MVNKTNLQLMSTLWDCVDRAAYAALETLLAAFHKRHTGSLFDLMCISCLGALPSPTVTICPQCDHRRGGRGAAVEPQFERVQSQRMYHVTLQQLLSHYQVNLRCISHCMAQPKSKHRPKKKKPRTTTTTQQLCMQPTKKASPCSPPQNQLMQTVPPPPNAPPHIMLNKTPFLLAPITANT
mgnify:CR=1 FL=1